MSDTFDYTLISSNVTSKVRPEAVRECLKRSFKDPKTRLPDESLNLVTEIVQKLVVEATLRSAKQAVRDHVTGIELEQVEKILPQLRYASGAGIACGAKITHEVLQMANKLGNHFITDDHNAEGALQFQCDLTACMAHYQESYKELCYDF